MKEDNQQMSDFECHYIQAYATQFDVLLDQSFLIKHSPKIHNNYSHLKNLVFFPSNHSEKKRQQIQEKYTQFSNNKIFCLLKVSKTNTPLTFDFIEAELISYRNINIVVNINTEFSNNYNYNLHKAHTNKKMGEMLVRKQLICYHSSDQFQSLFKINIKHICDLRLQY